MSYDRVAYSDKRPFSSEEYADDPSHPEKRHVNGNGIYNDYTVEVEPRTVKPLKFLCFTCKNTKRAKFVMICSGLVLLVCIVLVVVSAVAHAKHSKNSPPAKQYGLFAYGPDENGRVEYNLFNHNSYMQVFNRLEAHLHEYSPIPQENNPDKYISCEVFAGQTVAPSSDKVCRQTTAQFGQHCLNKRFYGILDGSPCILLVLKLQEGFVPKPFFFNETENIELHKILAERASNTSVGISCQGKTEADREAMKLKLYNASSEHNSMDNANGPQINYNPATGFPVYFFTQKKRNKDYISPAVMVQFNSLPVLKEVTIQCTAWAQNFNKGKPQDSSDYTVEFTFYIHN